MKIGPLRPFAPLRAALLACAALSLALAACQPGGAGAPAPTATFSPQATTAAGLVAEGDERLRLSDFAGAGRAYEKAIEADPAFAPAYSHLAYMHLFNPETRAAGLEEARKAVELAPNSAEAWAYLARAYDWNGQYEQARAAGEKAVELDAGNANAHSFLGEVYADLRLYDEAHEAAERAVQIDPDNAEARRNLGYLRNATSRYEDALAEWQAAHALEPQFVHRLTSIAVYYLYLRPDPVAARQWLTDALALAPADITALLFLARLDASLGDTAAAMAGCRRILELAPNAPDGHNCQANVHAESGNWEAAKEARLRAVAADPASENAQAGLGYAYFALGDCPQAVSQFEKVVKMFPRSGQAYAGLGLAQLCRGEVEAAIAAYEQAAALEPFNGSHRVGLGRIYLQQGRFNLAEREMRAAMALDPKSEQFAVWLGRVYAAQGDLARAIAQYEAAAALNPADGATATTLGFAQLQSGEYALAAQTFAQALDNFAARGGSPLAIAEAHYGLGLAYIAQDDCANAQPALLEALRLNPALTDAEQYLIGCRRSAGLAGATLPPALTASGPVSAEGALLLLDLALPALGVQGEARFQPVSGVMVLAVIYAASAPPNDPAFAAEQGLVVYAGSWALARTTAPVDNLLAAALAPDGSTLGTVHVRREHAQWWAQGLLEDDEFASFWYVTAGP